MKLTLVQLLLWVCAHSPFTCQGVQPPQIVHLPPPYLHLVQTGHPLSPYAADRDRVVYTAVYRQGVLFVSDKLPTDTGDFLTTLVHELYHHLQYVHGVRYACEAKFEPPAYRIARDFAREHGYVHHYPVLLVAIMSNCPGG